MVADLHFYFDPVCPFAWMTSKWVRLVQAQRRYTVDWRFISLRLLNAHVDYDAHFPPEYEAGHTARAAAAAGRRADPGRARPGRGRPAVRGARRPDLRARPVPDEAESAARRGTREFVLSRC